MCSTLAVPSADHHTVAGPASEHMQRRCALLSAATASGARLSSLPLPSKCPSPGAIIALPAERQAATCCPQSVMTRRRSMRWSVLCGMHSATSWRPAFGQASTSASPQPRRSCWGEGSCLYRRDCQTRSGRKPPDRRNPLPLLTARNLLQRATPMSEAETAAVALQRHRRVFGLGRADGRCRHSHRRRYSMVQYLRAAQRSLAYPMGKRFRTWVDPHQLTEGHW